ncbi:hypothetical protein [Enterobacter hormaechei]|uniref:hypothetical protein n=1 Tax=Enterobacter hormaechei TaxID=158836 RepID=UPI002021F12C|nr:hypothetical protein [Enterobacter hormaechei]MCL8077183.1 hypothetical protein [Enterobacter hormaechei]MCM6986685.1 hypothetical protein [Enterobacter hormaechei]MCM7056825.1 hypothetical protein [Enterobacter hormaechei]
MSVNRYEFEDYGTNEPDGRYVTYEDYAALEARCAALAAENAGLKSAIEKYADSYIMCGYCRTERDGKNDDVCEVLDSIPATDAFLAEVRAQGVEMLREHPAIKLCSLIHVCDEFAAQLRKGVQS